jgi:hypothetical protein
MTVQKNTTRDGLSSKNREKAIKYCGVSAWIRGNYVVRGFNPAASHTEPGMPIGSTPGFDRGVAGIRMSAIKKVEENGTLACANAMEVALDMKDEFEASIEKAVDAKEKLTETLKDFRGQVKNDLVSIGAAGDRVREETRKIKLAVDNVIVSMNSPEMLAAIQNAERLAAALKIIDELKTARVAFAVISEGPPDPVAAFGALPPAEKQGWRDAIKETFKEKEKEEKPTEVKLSAEK